MPLYFDAVDMHQYPQLCHFLKKSFDVQQHTPITNPSYVSYLNHGRQASNVSVKY